MDSLPFHKVVHANEMMLGEHTPRAVVGEWGG